MSAEVPDPPNEEPDKQEHETEAIGHDEGSGDGNDDDDSGTEQQDPQLGPHGRAMITERSLTVEDRINYGNPFYVPDHLTLTVGNKPFNLSDKGGLGLVKNPRSFTSLQVASNNDGHAPWNEANNKYGLHVLSLMLAMYDPTKKNNKLSPTNVCTTVLTDESKHLADLYDTEYTEPNSRTKNQMYRIFVGFSKPLWNCNRELMLIAAYFMQIRTGMTPEPVGELAALISAIKFHFVKNGASEDHKPGQLKNQKSWVFPIILLVNDHLRGYELCRTLKIEPIPFNPDSTLDELCNTTRDSHDKSIYVQGVHRIVEKRISMINKYNKYLDEYYKIMKCPVTDREYVQDVADDNDIAKPTAEERKRRRQSIF
jgi:hypothetical protein